MEARAAKQPDWPADPALQQLPIEAGTGIAPLCPRRAASTASARLSIGAYDVEQILSGYPLLSNPGLGHRHYGRAARLFGACAGRGRLRIPERLRRDGATP